jgi:glycine betaine/proline transport system ATP-binding protein
LPDLDNCPQAGSEDDLDTLIGLSIKQDKPVIIMADGKAVGVVTKDALLRGIQGET